MKKRIENASRSDPSSIKHTSRDNKHQPLNRVEPIDTPLQIRNAKGRYIVVMRVIGKGDRERVVPILPPALAAMGPPAESGAVFKVGGLRQVTYRFKQAARRAGVPSARLHDLRHTCLTWLVGHGVPLKLVQDIAGHSSITTAMRYAKIFTGDAHQVIKAAFGF